MHPAGLGEGRRACASIVVFEGRDAAGKGGTIKAITERVSPRVFRLVALPAPSDREKSQMYMQRYMQHFPAAGEIVIFDRSWYNRAGVEHVMGFCTDEQYERFLELCPLFERHIIDGGIMLIKFWLEVGNKEQERRFKARIDDPLRQWKLSNMDLPSRAKWYEYSRARDAMLKATDTRHAPWYIVRSDDKKRARLNTIAHLLKLIPHKKIERPKVKLPDRSKKHAYDDEATLARRRFVPRGLLSDAAALCRGAARGCERRTSSRRCRRPVAGVAATAQRRLSRRRRNRATSRQPCSTRTLVRHRDRHLLQPSDRRARARVLGRGPAERARAAARRARRPRRGRVAGPVEAHALDRRIADQRRIPQACWSLTAADVDEVSGETFEAATRASRRAAAGRRSEADGARQDACARSCAPRPPRSAVLAAGPAGRCGASGARSRALVGHTRAPSPRTGARNRPDRRRRRSAPRGCSSCSAGWSRRCDLALCLVMPTPRSVSCCGGSPTRGRGASRCAGSCSTTVTNLGLGVAHAIPGLFTVLIISCHRPVRRAADRALVRRRRARPG